MSESSVHFPPNVLTGLGFSLYPFQISLTVPVSMSSSKSKVLHSGHRNQAMGIMSVHKKVLAFPAILSKLILFSCQYKVQRSSKIVTSALAPSG